MTAEKNYLNSLGLSGEISEGLVIGSPAYAKDDFKTLGDNYASCNALNYDILIHNPYRSGAANPDCRALYDDAGAVYYRLLADTVTVSSECQPLKKTISDFFITSLLSFVVLIFSSFLTKVKFSESNIVSGTGIPCSLHLI